MTIPMFDNDGIDRESYAPFVLVNALETKWKDVRLSFTDWAWLEQEYGADGFEDYELNGYGLEGLVMACRVAAGLAAEAEGIHYNSQGDTCYIHFTNLAEAMRTAGLAAEMIQERDKLLAMMEVARENGFGDG